MAGKSEDRIKKAQFVGSIFFLPYTASLTYVNSYTELVDKVVNLEKRVFKLQSENRVLQEKLERSKRVEDLLDTKVSLDNEIIEIAEIIGTGSFFYYQTIMINVGLNDSVKKNQPVVAVDGLVGEIVSVYPTYSVVQTFRNKYFRAGAITERGRVNGILETSLHGNLYLRKIKIGCNIDIGDVVTTSKLSTNYPPGIPVGKVISIKKTSNNMFLEAQIEPFVNISTTEEVAVLRKNS